MLNLSATSMESSDILHMSEGLAKNQELASLDISNNGINEHCVKPLFKSMHAPCKLRILNLANNVLGDKAMKYLGQMIEFNYGRSKLERLDLTNTHITSNGLA